jgi:hypothetical protein
LKRNRFSRAFAQQIRSEAAFSWFVDSEMFQSGQATVLGTHKSTLPFPPHLVARILRGAGAPDIRKHEA